MKKLRIGAIFCSTVMLMTMNSNAYTMEFVKSKDQILPGEKIVVSVKLKDLEEEIDTFQSRIVYSQEDFNVVNESNFKLDSNWNGLVLNDKTGDFIVERNKKTKVDTEVVKITLESKSNLNKNKLNIALENNVVSGGKKDLETTDYSLDVNVKNDVTYGYDVVDDNIVNRIKPQTPIEDFIKIFKNGANIEVQVLEKDKLVGTGFMKTGMEIKVIKNGTEKVYKAAVIGDINGDGKVNTLDTKIIKAYRNEVIELVDESLFAADVNSDGKAELTDSRLILYHRADVKGFNLNYTK